jgi:hypothetical protein
MVSGAGRRRGTGAAAHFQGPGKGDAPARRHTYTGLTWDKGTCAWRVRVNAKSKQHHVGRWAAARAPGAACQHDSSRD